MSEQSGHEAFGPSGISKAEKGRYDEVKHPKATAAGDTALGAFGIAGGAHMLHNSKHGIYGTVKQVGRHGAKLKRGKTAVALGTVGMLGGADLVRGGVHELTHSRKRDQAGRFSKSAHDAFLGEVEKAFDPIPALGRGLGAAKGAVKGVTDALSGAGAHMAPKTSPIKQVGSFVKKNPMQTAGAIGAAGALGSGAYAMKRKGVI